MKHLKKIIFTAVLAAALSTSAFAASGFEFILNVPLGMGINLLPEFSYNVRVPRPNYITGYILSANYNSPNRLGFDTGVSAQIGYMWHVVNNFGISLLGEVGYSFDSLYGTYKFESADDGAASILPNEGISVSTYTHTLKVGLLPKFNINAFSIGIGGGVIIPMAASQSISVNGSKGSFQDTKLINPIGFYGKLTFDYSIFFTEKIALNIGLYTGVDYIGLVQTVIAGNPDSVGGQYLSTPFVTYDIGLQVGFRFGPKAFN